MAENIGIKMVNGATNDVIAPFTLSPGQTTSFQIQFMIDSTTISTDTSATISGIDVAADHITSTGWSFPDVLYYQPQREVDVIYFNVVATGANTYVATEHINTFTLSAMSPWTSGNAVSGESDTFENIDFTENPMICSFSLIFSTVNVSPSGLTNFTATPGNESIALTWTNPTGTGLSATVITYKEGAIPSAVDDGTMAQLASSATSYTITGLNAEVPTLYGFMGTVYDLDGELSSVTTSAQPVWITTGGRVWSSHAEFLRKHLLGYF